MYRILAAFLALLLLVGTVYAQENPAMRARVNELDQMRARGEITFVQRSQLMRDFAGQRTPLNSADMEYWSYHAMLSSELDAGRMNWQQFEYAVTVKRNEINARANAQILQLLPYAIQEQQQQEAARQRAFKPYTYTPPPTYNTNCTRDGFGNTNCTTTRQ